MRLIDPRDDLAALLAKGAEASGPPATDPASPSAGGRALGRPADPAVPRRNRAAIPLRDSLDGLREPEAERPAATDDEASSTTAGKKRETLRAAGRYDRHGLPLLDAEADLGRLLDPAAPAREEDFARLLEADLRGAGASAIRRRKRDHLPPPSVPLAKRLARYPAPQGELDLHGFTAARADQRTMDYIRAMRGQGFSTLRIIVGRGRHSEGGAVLPDVVEDRLVALRQAGEVLAFRWEKRVKRRSGSVVVYLGREERPGG